MQVFKSYLVSNLPADADYIEIPSEDASNLNIISLAEGVYLLLTAGSHQEVVQYLYTDLHDNGTAARVYVKRGQKDTAPISFPRETCIEFYAGGDCLKVTARGIINEIKYRIWQAWSLFWNLKTRLKNKIKSVIYWIRCHIKGWILFWVNFWNKVLATVKHIALSVIRWVVGLIDWWIDFFINLGGAFVNTLTKAARDGIKALLAFINKIEHFVDYWVKVGLTVGNALRVSLDTHINQGLRILNANILGLYSLLNNATGNIFGVTVNAVGDGAGALGKQISDWINNVTNGVIGGLGGIGDAIGGAINQGIGKLPGG